MLAVVLFLSACGGSSTASLTSSDAAVVGDQTVTQAQLAALMTRAQHVYVSQGRAFPKLGTQAYESLKGQAITFLVQRAEFMQKADELGVHVSSSQIDQRIEEAKKQFYHDSEAAYEKALRQQGLTTSDARDDVEAQLVEQGVYNKVTKNVKVSDSEIQQYYDKNKSLYQQAESRDVRHILVSSKALADKIYAQLVAAKEKNFAALAKKYSKDPSSASVGGKLTITKGQTVPPFDKTAFSLKTGQLSKPVHTQYGWHVIQALSPIRPPTKTPLSKVRASISAQLLSQKKNTVMTAWVQAMTKAFCKPGHIKYQVGYQPSPDPCLAVTSTNATT